MPIVGACANDAWQHESADRTEGWGRIIEYLTLFGLGPLVRYSRNCNGRGSGVASLCHLVGIRSTCFGASRNLTTGCAAHSSLRFVRLIRWEMDSCRVVAAA